MSTHVELGSSPSPAPDGPEASCEDRRPITRSNRRRASRVRHGRAASTRNDSPSFASATADICAPPETRRHNFSPLAGLRRAIARPLSHGPASSAQNCRHSRVKFGAPAFFLNMRVDGQEFIVHSARPAMSKRRGGNMSRACFLALPAAMVSGKQAAPGCPPCSSQSYSPGPNGTHWSVYCQGGEEVRTASASVPRTPQARIISSKHGFSRGRGPVSSLARVPHPSQDSALVSSGTGRGRARGVE
jgi:hypothetical protein